MAALLLAVLGVFAAGAGVASYFAVKAADREKKAIAAADLADENARAADEKARDSVRQQARLQVEKAYRLLGDGDLPGALLCFTEALRLEEGNPQPETVHRRRLAALLRHCPVPEVAWSIKGPVRAAAFNEDGSRLVTVTGNPTEGKSPRTTYGREARVWDASTGRPLSPPLRGHRLGVRSAIFSPDGQFVVTSGTDGTERGRRAPSGSRPPGLPPSRSPFPGRQAPAAYRTECIVWEAAIGKRLTQALPCRTWHIAADGRRLLLINESEQLEVRQFPDGKLLSTRSLSETGSARFLFRPDGREVLVSERSGWLACDVEGRASPRPLSRSLPNAISQYSRDGRHLLVFDRNQARIHDAITGEPVTPPLYPGRFAHVSGYDGSSLRRGGAGTAGRRLYR